MAKQKAEDEILLSRQAAEIQRQNARIAQLEAMRAYASRTALIFPQTARCIA